MFKKSEDSVIYIFWAKIFQILIYFPIIFYILYKFGFNREGIAPIIGSGIFHFFYWLFISLGYKYGELSLVYPIARSSPLLIALLSYFIFGEKVTLYGFIGIILIISGIYFISVGDISFKNFLKILNKENKGLIYAFSVFNNNYNSLFNR